MKHVRRLIVFSISTAILSGGIAAAAPLQSATAKPSGYAVQQNIPQLNAPVPWSLSGNAATNAQQNFIGTIDAQPLVFKTNGTEQMRIGADGMTLLRKLWIGYGASGGAKPPAPVIEFYSPPYNISISSPSPGMLYIGRQTGASGVALDVSGDVRASGKFIATAGVSFPDGSVQTTAQINKGDKGDKGPAGPAGPPGPQGPAGSGAVIAGEIDPAGQVLRGKNFTIARINTGVYEISFPGGIAPVCTATLNGGFGTDIRCGRSVGKIIVSVYMLFNNKITMYDQGFSFICLMP